MSNMEKVKLAPCPFCGSTDIEEDYTGVSEWGGISHQDGDVTCHNCKAICCMVDGGDSDQGISEELRIKWNSRAPTPHDIDTAHDKDTIRKLTEQLNVATKLADRLKVGNQNYHELLYAVATKHPEQSRHETALMYITNAEKHSDKASKGSTE